MPSLIEDYIQLLLNAVANSPIVSASNIQLDKRTNRSGLIRGDLFFGDGSRLHFRELVTAEDLVIRLMYSSVILNLNTTTIVRYGQKVINRPSRNFFYGHGARSADFL